MDRQKRVSDEHKKPAIIDPFPILGDILNHHERMMWRMGTLVIEMMGVVKKAELMTPQLAEYERQMLDTFKDYEAFKAAMSQKTDDESP